MALLSSSLACTASMAPSSVPSPEERSMVCSWIGICDTLASVFLNASFLAAFPAARRCLRVLAARISIVDDLPNNHLTVEICFSISSLALFFSWFL